MARTPNKNKVSHGDISTVEGMVCSETGIEIPDDLAFDRWELALGRLGPVQRGAAWWIGDLLVFAGKHYGDTYAAAQEATGYRLPTLKNFKWVAGKLPPEVRRPELTWGSHRFVAGLPPNERDGWLDRAVAGGWTSVKLSQELHRKDQMVAVADLKAHPSNYRSHPKDQLRHIGQSIRDHGIYRPVVVANDGTILAGHGIWEAAKEEGLDEVPVQRLDVAPDDPKAIKLLAGDNELGRIAADDDRLLTDQLKAVKDSEGLLGTGYDERQLAVRAFVTRREEEIANHDAAAHWVGMPKYDPTPPPPQVVVSFEDESARDEFMELIGGVTVRAKNRQTWSVWWPERSRGEDGQAEFIEVGE